MACDLLKILSGFLEARRLQGSPLLAGFSGGADSTALLLALHQLGQKLTAVHFQHGLRGGSAASEEAWCRSFCRRNGIPFLSRQLQVPGRKQAGETVEEAARRLRLLAWQELSDQGRIPVFLAHHGDDCLEDLFLRLARGGNSSSLTALRPVRRVDGVLLCRPFLGVRKSDLLDFLRSQGLSEWCCDDSNQDNRFRRNAVRNLLLPEFRRIFRSDLGLRQARETLLQDAEFLEQLSAARFPQLTSRAAWQALPPALLPRVLRLFLTRETGRDTPPPASLCRRLRQALEKGNPAAQLLPAGKNRQLILDQRGLRFWEAPAENPLRRWNWRRDPCLALPEFSAFLQAFPAGETPPSPGTVLAREEFNPGDLPEELLVRGWQPGDVLVPFGATFRKKLQDLFTDAHVARDRRTRIPLLLAGCDIIWVPGVRRAEFARTREGIPGITIEYGRPKQNPNKMA